MKRRVLITGTTSGIGQGLMKHYYDQSWEITAVNRRQDRDLESRFPGVQFKTFDVRDLEAVRSYFKEASEKGELPELYYLNAGINKVDCLEMFSVDVFREVLEINLMGVLTFIDAAFPYLRRRQATFVATSSTSNIFPNPNNLAYYISKTAESKIFRLLDRRFRLNGLRFKTVILGPVATNIFAGGALNSKLQTRIRDFLTVSVEKAVPAITRFVSSQKEVLYYPKIAVFVFLLAAFLQKLFPGLYKGSVSASLPLSKSPVGKV